MEKRIVVGKKTPSNKSVPRHVKQLKYEKYLNTYPATKCKSLYFDCFPSLFSIQSNLIRNLNKKILQYNGKNKAISLVDRISMICFRSQTFFTMDTLCIQLRASLYCTIKFSIYKYQSVVIYPAEIYSDNTKDLHNLDVYSFKLPARL